MKYEILNADCMEFMKSQPNNFFDLAICDPPYFSGPEKRGNYGKKISNSGAKRKDYIIFNAWMPPKNSYFEQVKRVSKNWIIWGYNYFEFCHIGKFETPRGKDINEFLRQNPEGWIVWDKVNGNTSYNDFEMAFTSYKISSRIFRFMWNGMFQGKSIKEGHIQRGDKSKNQNRIHPTEKPYELYGWLLNEYSLPGFKILDTHLGSASIIVGAQNFDVYITGIEIEKACFDLAQKRLNQILVPKLF